MCKKRRPRYWQKTDPCSCQRGCNTTTRALIVQFAKESRKRGLDTSTALFGDKPLVVKWLKKTRTSSSPFTFQHVPSKRRYPPARLYDVTFQKTTIWAIHRREEPQNSCRESNVWEQNARTLFGSKREEVTGDCRTKEVRIIMVSKIWMVGHLG